MGRSCWEWMWKRILGIDEEVRFWRVQVDLEEVEVTLPTAVDLEQHVVDSEEQRMVNPLDPFPLSFRARGAEGTRTRTQPPFFAGAGENAVAAAETPTLRIEDTRDRLGRGQQHHQQNTILTTIFARTEQHVQY